MSRKRPIVSQKLCPFLRGQLKTIKKFHRNLWHPPEPTTSGPCPKGFCAHFLGHNIQKGTTYWGDLGVGKKGARGFGGGKEGGPKWVILGQNELVYFISLACIPRYWRVACKLRTSISFHLPLRSGTCDELQAKGLLLAPFPLG